MRTYDANCWEDYNSYTYKKKAMMNRPKNKINKKRRNKREKESKVRKVNSKILEAAQLYANDMIMEPSELEKKMQQFLERFNVKYQFQKVFDIKKKDGYIYKFYIADFYIPSKNLIIETDGSFHDNQIEKDALRSNIIKENYPNVKIIRWKWHDFDSYAKTLKLLNEIR